MHMHMNMHVHVQGSSLYQIHMGMARLDVRVFDAIKFPAVGLQPASSRATTGPHNNTNNTHTYVHAHAAAGRPERLSDLLH